MRRAAVQRLPLGARAHVHHQQGNASGCGRSNYGRHRTPAVGAPQLAGLRVRSRCEEHVRRVQAQQARSCERERLDRGPRRRLGREAAGGQVAILRVRCLSARQMAKRRVRRTPRSQMMQTMVAFSTCSATRSAPATQPPDDTPAKMPSQRASARMVSSASCCVMSSVWSTRLPSKMDGMYSAGQRRMPGMLAPSAGCRPTICTSLLWLFRKRLVPIAVPVVPMLVTKCVMRPLVCSHSSGPVV